MNPAPPSKTGTVFIVDDDLSFLRSVSRLLRATGYSVQPFESVQEFLNQLAPDISGCVVTDLQMPGLNGLDLQATLKKTANPLPIIFLTGHADVQQTVSAMRNGADDFLTKLVPKEELLAAIDRALARDANERKRRAEQNDLHSRFDTLSERELEVLAKVVQGKMNKEIADQLKINLRTVKLHRTNLTRKLEVHSVAELTRLAHEAGLFREIKNTPSS